MILRRKSALSVAASGLALALVLAACGGSSDATSERSPGRVKNAALVLGSTTSLVAGQNMTQPTLTLASTTTLKATTLTTTPGIAIGPRPTTTLVAGQNMTQPTLTLASTTTLKATTLTTTPGIAIGPRPTTTLVAGQNMTQPTVVLASTTTLQSSTVFGQRWASTTFDANAIDAANTPACTNVAAPAGLTQSTGTQVKWTSTMAPPATDDTADLVYIEISADGAKWVPVSYTRTTASSAQLLGTKSGQKFQLRAAFYRSGTTACIGKMSPAISIVIK